MFWNVLKKDFQRKRAMNLILLLFVLFSVMFIGASVKNMTVLTGSLERFFEMAGVKDFYVFVDGNEQAETMLKEWAKEEELIDTYKYSDSMVVGEGNLKREDGTQVELKVTTIVMPQNAADFVFFDEKDEKIKIKEGEIYLPRQIFEANEFQKGEILKLEFDNYQKDFIVAGWFKDALLGSNMMGTKRILLHSSDYAQMSQKIETMHFGALEIQTDDVEKVRQKVTESGALGILSLVDKDTVEMSYVFDVVIAMVLSVVSLCLILIAFLLLRFTIGVTIQEEIKEIGILKAIGIKDSSIRGLYSSKYMILSVIGAILGFAGSIPFGNLFLKEVSQNIVMQTGNGAYISNFLCALLVVVFVTGFAYNCTGRMKKMSAITAIRSGNSGERFSQKGFLKLHKFTKIPTVFFLSCNDILSNLKRYFILLFTFALGLLLIIIPINSLNTLEDDSIVTTFGMKETEVYLVAHEEKVQIVSHHSREYVEKLLAEIQDKVREKGIEAEVFVELAYNFEVTKNELSTRSSAMQGVGTDATEYFCLQGDAPRYHNEIMLTKRTADRIGAVVGDTVKITIGEEEREYVVSGLFQSMINMGEGIRFHQDEQIDGNMLSGYFAIQLDLQEDYTNKELKEIRNEVAGIFPDMEVFGAQKYIDNLIGGIAGYMSGLKQVIVLVVICINILVSVMMVKTFIARERAEISMLKSLGFSNNSLMWWQSGRIGILLVCSSVLGILLSEPLSQLSTTPIFRLMGAESVNYVVKPFETFVAYPLLLLAITMTASLLAATDICKIPVNEINNME